MPPDLHKISGLSAESLSGFSPRRALIIKLGHIGDVLVTTPVITALKNTWPELSIDMVVNQGTEAMVRHNPLLNEVLILKREHASSLAALPWHLGFIRGLRGRRYDLALEMSGGDRGAFLAWISGAGLRVGFEPKEPHLRAKAFHRLAPLWDLEHHLVETFQGQLQALGIEAPPGGLSFYPGPEGEARAKQLLAAAGLGHATYALVHPTSRWMFKTWTPAGVAAVMGHLAEAGFKLVLTSGPDPAELEWVRRLKDNLDAQLPLFDISGQLDLYTLGALIKRARMFFGVDSAPMHLAAALGTPVLTIFGPSGESMWGPWQVPAEVVVGACEEHPCGRSGCDGSKISRCLDELEPAVVIAAADRLLGRT